MRFYFRWSWIKVHIFSFRSPSGEFICLKVVIFLSSKWSHHTQIMGKNGLPYISYNTLQKKITVSNKNNFQPFFRKRSDRVLSHFYRKTKILYNFNIRNSVSFTKILYLIPWINNYHFGANQSIQTTLKSMKGWNIVGRNG